MKKLSIILFLLIISAPCFSQNSVPIPNDPTVLNFMSSFHEKLIKGDSSISDYAHEKLSYGHSNGWIENRKEFLENLKTGYIIYHSFKVDSTRLVIAENTASIRFIADIEATLNGKKGNFHLKVLEVWVLKDKRWQLLARQAVKG